MRKKIFAFLLMVLMLLGLVGCGRRETASSNENKYTQEIMEQSSDVIGYPDVSNFFEKAQLKEIYELRDDPQLICYWYTKNDMSGKWIYQGKCVGYGIPYTTQFTQPETLQWSALPALKMNGEDKGYNTYSSQILPQADPNGLYSSASTSATWILSVDEDGNITPSYVESEITVTQRKMDARLCEDWSLTTDYSTMSDKAEIKGEVDTSILGESKDSLDEVTEETKETEETEETEEEE